jgi:hypothetical protein
MSRVSASGARSTLESAARSRDGPITDTAVKKIAVEAVRRVGIFMTGIIIFSEAWTGCQREKLRRVSYLLSQKSMTPEEIREGGVRRKAAEEVRNAGVCMARSY